MNTNAINDPKTPGDSEEDEQHLALLIHQAGEDARIHTKITMDKHFKKLNDMIDEAVLSQKENRQA
ncbi:MAG: hypothetical protein ACOYOE_03275 [Chlorobium sp.]